ncbi:MAG: T9SS type A sorting domain-containing protein [Candidatus Aegiribacteria sp.]|nr:T9SS type A sorting domain-containing protein [Candidatus Aegiribacteria sp.]
MLILILSLITGFQMTDEIIWDPADTVQYYPSIRIVDALLMANGNVITAGYGIVEDGGAYPRDLAIRIFDFNSTTPEPIYATYYSWSGSQGDEYFDDSNALFRGPNGWIAGGYMHAQLAHPDPRLYWVEVNDYTSKVRDDSYADSNWEDCSYWDGVYASNKSIYLCGWVITDVIHPMIQKENAAPIIDTAHQGENSRIWEDDLTGNLIVTGSHVILGDRTPRIYLYDSNLNSLDDDNIVKYGGFGGGPAFHQWSDYIITVSSYLHTELKPQQPYLTLNYFKYNSTQNTLTREHYENIDVNPDEYEDYTHFGVQGLFLGYQNTLLVTLETGIGYAICELEISSSSFEWATSVSNSFIEPSKIPYNSLFWGGGCDFKVTQGGAITGVLGAHLSPDGSQSDEDNFIWLAKIDEVDVIPFSSDNFPLGDSEIQIVENPFTESACIHVVCGSSLHSTLQVIDISGRVVYSGATENESILVWNGLNTNGLQTPSGVYFAVIRDINGSIISSAKMMKL